MEKTIENSEVDYRSVLITALVYMKKQGSFDLTGKNEDFYDFALGELGWEIVDPVIETISDEINNYRTLNNIVIGYATGDSRINQDNIEKICECLRIIESGGEPREKELEISKEDFKKIAEIIKDNNLATNIVTEPLIFMNNSKVSREGYNFLKKYDQKK